MPSTPPPHNVPLAHGTTFRGVIDAAKDLWGDPGLRDIASRLPPDTRRVMIEELLLPMTWHPTRMLTEFCHAVWDGPAMRQEGSFDLFCDRQIDMGMRRMQRVLMRMLTPGLLAKRAASIWRGEHTHGEIDVTLGDKRATVTFRDHPYLASPVMVRLMAESMRYLGSLSRVDQVRESHRLERDKLVVQLTWE